MSLVKTKTNAVRKKKKTDMGWLTKTDLWADEDVLDKDSAEVTWFMRLKEGGRRRRYLCEVQQHPCGWISDH